MLCFASYATLLKHSKSKSVSQKELISKVIISVSGDNAWTLEEEDATVSRIISGKSNLPSYVPIDAREADLGLVANYFEENIIGLLDPNKIKKLINALKDVIYKDSAINNDTIVEPIDKLTKIQILSNDITNVSTFLAGIFLYVARYTKNCGSSDFVKKLTREYFDSFNDKCLLTDNLIEKELKSISLQSQYTVDEVIKEAVRLFCIEHEEDLSLLPLCEIAYCLNSEHKHIRPLFTDFICQRKTIQEAILINKGIKPFEFPKPNWLSCCIEAFEKEISELKLSSHSFLYEGAKYFHYAFLKYANHKPKDINPYAFERKYVEKNLPSFSGCLSSLIDDYFYGIENYPSDKNSPPFDVVWDQYDLYTCDEYIFSFWICRFIIDVCYCLHGLDVSENKNENWNKKLINEECIETMEDLYYYAILMLYLRYGEENQ